MPIQDTSYKYNYIAPSSQLSFPVKINIHFPVRGDLYSDCVTINSAVTKIARSEVKYDPISFQMPHITLYSGMVEDQQNLFRLLETINRISKTLQPFPIKASRPYLKKPRANYVFYDVEPASQIHAIKRNIKDAVDDFVKPLTWDVVGEPPHITLAYVREKAAEIDQLLNESSEGSTSKADALEVSFGGPRGSCLGVIRTFELSVNKSLPH